MPLNFQNKYTQASAKKAYEERPKMGDLVSDGTSFRCPNCPSKIKICVTTSSAVGDSLKLANTGNYYFPPPGGLCAITGSPCVPVLTNTDPGQKVVQIDEKTALGAGCKFQCAQGGQLFVDSPGQTVAKHEVSPLEIALDVAMVAALLVPVAGELADAAIIAEEAALEMSEEEEAVLEATSKNGVEKPTEPVKNSKPTQTIEKNGLHPEDKSSPTKKKLTIEPSRQNKHIETHPHYKNKLKQHGVNNDSLITHTDPQGLVDKYAGTGTPNNYVTPGESGYRETVDFKEHIGYSVDKTTGERTPTNYGKIHYDGQDRVHIIPVKPPQNY